MEGLLLSKFSSSHADEEVSPGFAGFLAKTKKGRLNMKRVLVSVVFAGLFAAPTFARNEGEGKHEKEKTFVIKYDCDKKKHGMKKLRENEQVDPCVAVDGKVYKGVAPNRQL